MPLKPRSCPSGIATGTAARPNDLSIVSNARSKEAFSRSMRFTTIIRASENSSA